MKTLINLGVASEETKKTFLSPSNIDGLSFKKNVGGHMFYTRQVPAVDATNPTEDPN